MSSTLGWEVYDREHKDLPDELKYILRKYSGDGSVDQIMDDGDLKYLRGLDDANIDGAKELIRAIEKHGKIIVKEYF